jgi:hypothetical protein
MKLEDAKKKYDFLFVQYEAESPHLTNEKYVPIDEIDKFIANNNILNIYGTYLKPLEIDANFIVENACEESYEDCFEDILRSGGMVRLQKYLDEWCEKYGRPSYDIDCSARVEI